MKKIVVVTGSSSGMGKEFARQIACKVSVDEVWLIARNKDKLNEVSKEISIPVKVISLDLTKENELEKYSDFLKNEQPQIAVLCNCAGYGKLNHYENEKLETYMNMIDLNVKAYVSMINKSLPYMRCGSKIMNLASSSAFQPLPYMNIYAATKAFILSYSRALNRELNYRGIHVLAVCPYWVRTDFFERAIDSGEKQVVIKYQSIYEPKAVIGKAIHDLYTKKDVSVYGMVDHLQRIGAKVLPHCMVMDLWMRVQKLDGTREIRREKARKH